MTQGELAERLNISVQAVSQWETDKTAPNSKNLIDISKMLEIRLSAQHHISIETMLWKMAPGNKPAVKAPLVPWGSRAEWLNLQGNWEEPEEFYGEDFFDIRWKPIGEVFALECKSDAMAPVFQYGDHVIIDTGRAPEKADYVVAEVGHMDPFLAQFFPLGVDKNRVPIFELRYLAADRKPIVVNAENSGQVIGTVREHRRYYRTS